MPKSTDVQTSPIVSHSPDVRGVKIYT
jgi:hypothetical protein